MDFKMQAERIRAGENPVWDCKVQDGIVPLISGRKERRQTATLAGFLQRGTIPQLMEVGVPWQGFLTKTVTFGELDSYVRESIMETGMTEYYPQYEIEEDRLVMTIGTELEET